MGNLAWKDKGRRLRQGVTSETQEQRWGQERLQDFCDSFEGWVDKLRINGAIAKIHEACRDQIPPNLLDALEYTQVNAKRNVSKEAAGRALREIKARRKKAHELRASTRRGSFSI